MGDSELHKSGQDVEASRQDAVSQDDGPSSDEDASTIFKGELDPVYEAKARMLNKAVRIASFRPFSASPRGEEDADPASPVVKEHC